jgi:hypothetical protein
VTGVELVRLTHLWRGALMTLTPHKVGAPPAKTGHDSCMGTASKQSLNETDYL